MQTDLDMKFVHRILKLDLTAKIKKTSIDEYAVLPIREYLKYLKEKGCSLGSTKKERVSNNSFYR